MVSKTPEEIMVMKSNRNAIVIHDNELEPSLVPKLIMECNNADYWHKFVVENVEKYERDFILKTIMDFIYPEDIIPLNFVKRKRAFFLARNCLGALLKLTSNKLVVPNPLDPDMPLKLVIIANHYSAQQLKFDFEKEIINILKKRYKRNKRRLNLKEFHKDKDLHHFFLLSQPKLLLYVLQFAADFPFLDLNLSGNCIKTIIPIRLLAGCDLRSIDLSNNEISCLEDLTPLKEFEKLSVLTLNGNPVCKDWDPYSYVKTLRDMFPNLDTIDGQSLSNEPAFDLVEHTNFLCSRAGGDLVSQFLEHFFMRYDSDNRLDIAPLYHKNAMFSVTYRIIADQKSCRNIQLDHYRLIDRNMKGFGGPRNQFLFRGRKAIMNAFSKLPRSSHDSFVFRCDLIYYTEVQAILVVNGIFREDKRYIGFTRNFVLKNEDNEYSITNDQLHVYNALNRQLQTCDCYPMRVEISNNPLPYDPQQYVELQKAVHKITSLNYDYSQRFLEAYHYDLKKTLEGFIDMHLKDEIPPEAFIQIGEQGLIIKEAACVTKLPFAPSLIGKTYRKHPVVTSRRMWQTLKDYRLAAGYNIVNSNANKDAVNAEAEEIKKNIPMGVAVHKSNQEIKTIKQNQEIKSMKQNQEIKIIKQSQEIKSIKHNQEKALVVKPIAATLPKNRKKRRRKNKRLFHQQKKSNKEDLTPLDTPNQQIKVFDSPVAPEDLKDPTETLPILDLTETHPNNFNLQPKVPFMNGQLMNSLGPTITDDRQRLLETLNARVSPQVIRLPIEVKNLCWRCGQIGHLRATCKEPPVLFCSHCGLLGVFSNSCQCRQKQSK